MTDNRDLITDRGLVIRRGLGAEPKDPGTKFRELFVFSDFSISFDNSTLRIDIVIMIRGTDKRTRISSCSNEQEHLKKVVMLNRENHAF